MMYPVLTCATGHLKLGIPVNTSSHLPSASAFIKANGEMQKAVKTEYAVRFALICPLTKHLYRSIAGMRHQVQEESGFRQVQVFGVINCACISA